MGRVLVGFGAVLVVLLTTMSPVEARGGAVLGVKMSTSRARPGQLVAYTVTVSNRGAPTTHGLTVRLRLPRQVELIELSPASCAERRRVVRCALGDLRPGTSATVRATGIVAPGASGTLVAVADVHSGPDRTARSVIRTRVEPGTNLAVRIRAPRNARPHTRVPVLITVVNRGPRRSGRVTLLLGSHGTRLVPPRGPRCKIVRDGATSRHVRCVLPSLPPGGHHTLHAAAHVNRQQYFAATVSSRRGEIRPDDNSTLTGLRARAAHLQRAQRK
ncbi:hypothetical protein [Spirillospora sp. CA-294931]|uniref:hypothetical protein n=1 Tax=Spirillospora sp. CA-294931 TaxID=3240042 RepID=UPI003D8CC335